MNTLPEHYELEHNIGWDSFKTNEEFDDSYRRLGFKDFEYESDIFITYLPGGINLTVDMKRKRRVILQVNRSGHDSYPLLQPGDGYLFTIVNDDLGTAQLGTKPVRLVTATDHFLVFRGHDVLAMGPFGLVDPGNTDYGVAVFLDNKRIRKIALYRYDTKKCYEYAHTFKYLELANLSIPSSNPSLDMRSLSDRSSYKSELLAIKLVEMYTNNEEGADDLCWDLLDALKHEIHGIPSFSAISEIAMALGWFLEGDHFNTYDEDEKASQVTAIGFAQYFLTKAIYSNGGSFGQNALPTLYNLRFNTSWEYNKTMFMLIAHSREEEFLPQSFYFSFSDQVKARRYTLDLQAMYLSDALKEPSILSMNSAINNIFRDEISHYDRSSWPDLLSNGTKCYNELEDYLTQRIQEGRTDF